MIGYCECCDEYRDVSLCHDQDDEDQVVLLCSQCRLDLTFMDAHYVVQVPE